MGPTIQQGVIQRPVQRGIQSNIGARPKNVQQTGNVPPSQGDNSCNHTSGPEENGGDRLPECNEDSFPNGYVLNCIHEGRPFSLNDVARPVFVSHYYAGEQLMPITNKKCIRLDECDVLSENSLRNPQSQAINHEISEHSRESLAMQQQVINGRNVGPIPSENLQEHNYNRGIHSEFPEQSHNSLKNPKTTQRDDEPLQMGNAQGHKQALHSEFKEPS